MQRLRKQLQSSLTNYCNQLVLAAPAAAHACHETIIQKQFTSLRSCMAPFVLAGEACYRRLTPLCEITSDQTVMSQHTALP